MKLEVLQYHVEVAGADPWFWSGKPKPKLHFFQQNASFPCWHFLLKTAWFWPLWGSPRLYKLRALFLQLNAHILRHFFCKFRKIKSSPRACLEISKAWRFPNLNSGTVPFLSFSNLMIPESHTTPIWRETWKHIVEQTAPRDLESIFFSHRTGEKVQMISAWDLEMFTKVAWILGKLHRSQTCFFTCVGVKQMSFVHTNVWTILAACWEGEFWPQFVYTQWVFSYDTRRLQTYARHWPNAHPSVSAEPKAQFISGNRTSATDGFHGTCIS